MESKNIQLWNKGIDSHSEDRVVVLLVISEDYSDDSEELALGYYDEFLDKWFAISIDDKLEDIGIPLYWMSIPPLPLSKTSFFQN